MLRKIYVLLVLGIATYTGAYAQSGTLKGKVVDETTNEPLPFANVIVELNGAQSGASQTDFDGNYTIKPLVPGKYSIKASYVGYSPAQVNGVLISSDKITFYDVKMSKGAVNINEVKIVDYKVPLIDKGNPSTSNTITSEEIRAAPTRSVNSLIATSAGTYQKDEGDPVNVRGSRDENTTYFVDGIKIRGATALPNSAIEQITVVTGGVPAQYGDATGGIINITTRGPSQSYYGGVEFVTSELFNKYGYNLLGVNISGPILFKKEADGSKSALLGFFASGELESQKVPDPPAGGFTQVLPETLDYLNSTPYRKNPNGNGVQKNSEFITDADMEHINYMNNVKSDSYRLQGKFDIQASKNLTFAVGGSYQGNSNRGNVYNNALFNFSNNPYGTSEIYRVFARMTQKIGSNDNADEKSSSVIKNAYYTLQVDWSTNKTKTEDKNHGSNLFDYGYLGTYHTYQNDSVFVNAGTPQAVIVGTDTVFANYVNLYQDTLVTYAPGGLNPNTEAYTNLWYELAPQVNGYYNTPQAIQGGGVTGGLLNGDQPTNVYSLWTNTGNQFNGYNFASSNQARVSGMVSADIKNHALQVGFEFEQRKDANWGSAPVGLWTTMRQQENLNLRGLDYLHGTLYGDTIIANSYIYQSSDNPYTGDSNSVGFFELVRQKLGVANTEWIDIDAYDYLNNPGFLSLDLFSADELIKPGLIGYRGYDYTGTNRTDNATFQDYFSKLDENGNPTREIAPFQPIYMAGYIQDKFAINDLIFNIGLRIDRYDANQKVQKDPYSLYQTVSAGQLSIPDRPGNIGDNYVVYVSDVSDPSNADIVGYRDGTTWYDASGAVIADPGVLAQQTTTGTISPYLVDPESNIQLTSFDVNTSFKDYEPQVSLMPRIALSFPISDVALFFAHYDVLTQRPTSNVAINPRAYFNYMTGTFNNPNLRPTKTVDYELGFKQSVSRSSSITLTAFYREMNDMIQQQRVNYAYPNSYTTYGNVDFGTVKGLSFTYDLRRTGNIRLSASYTLQFADGTGSNAASNSELISSGQPNLFTIAPLDFDQRNTIVATIDYRYSSGADYNGPVWFGTQFFANAGANFIFRAGSGAPYSSTTLIRTEADNIGLQQAGTTPLAGGVNTSNLPWTFRCDLRLDKDFTLKKGKDGKRGLILNAYFLVQNIFNTANVTNVYRATGSASDDGYLNYSAAQGVINASTDPEAYKDLYNVKVNNPYNYSTPRQMRLGIELQF